MMSKVKNKPSQQLEIYCVMVEGNPVVVEATSLEDAIKKVKSQAVRQEVGDVSS